MDRSLGRLIVPRILRAHGVSLTTLSEHYGEAAGQTVIDTDWIRLTAERGWVGFHKDAAISRNDAERDAVMESAARMFCIPRADITGEDSAQRFIRNLEAIRLAAQSDGPFIYKVLAHHIERLY
ncbi:hypothetical protein CQY22_007925 [Mycolicibacterium brumae]|uniref:VapC45 PIN like domain-containing protein n=1 Tax=Mycolicibacterium brumae TaxID=85968 RepID=A0A2G5PCD2_9MYCO|nr:hypothetical protein CQY22_007925 [Mycolicibacterium brumae]